MADWPDVVQLAITSLVPAASGLCGVGLGAWAVTRRERRNEKRDAYAALLVGFQATRAAYRRMEALYDLHLPTSDAGALGKLVEDSCGPEFREARAKLNGAMAIGRLILDRSLQTLLDTYLRQDAEGADRPGLFVALQARREAIEQTMAQVETMARAELGLD
jgi:hypothetical protein